MTKHYRRWDDGQPEREWRALRLLAVHAPDLAPVPVHAVLDPAPMVVMSRLPGAPLGAAPVTTAQLAAMASAITTLQSAIPASALTELPPRLGHPAEMLTAVRTRHTAACLQGVDPLVTRAFDAGADWLFDPGRDAAASAPATMVLASGDGNLGNFLWDAGRGRVQLVDFEYSGLAPRAFELAEIAEHISMWSGGAVDPRALLEHFDLTGGEAVLLCEFRRLLAIWWLLALLPNGGAAHARNPAATVQLQADRLLALLG
ncbi:phosphotransferase family protein [Streptosporangium sp. CA-115845]|uniref:phosphotransferase family protein n=1 Tax=Streptosporangium sp. CA-115845 TaxID=3240071 RepID=UPI003D8DB579